MKANQILSEIDIPFLIFFNLAVIVFLFFFFSYLGHSSISHIPVSIFIIGLSLALQRFRLGRSIKELGFGLDSTVVKNSLLTIFITLSAIVSIIFVYTLINFPFDNFFLNFSENLMILGKAFSLFFFSLNTLLVLDWVIMEELVFRGISFQHIMEKSGSFWAVIISSLAFAAFHYFNPFFSGLAFINIFIAGILMSIMYIKSRSLYPQIIFHFLWNILTLNLGSNVSGFNNSINGLLSNTYEFSTGINKIIFGGYFGIESGVLATIILLILLVTTLKYFEQSPYVESLIFKRKFIKDYLQESQVNAQ